jgi:hypothetical protein
VLIDMTRPSARLENVLSRLRESLAEVTASGSARRGLHASDGGTSCHSYHRPCHKSRQPKIDSCHTVWMELHRTQTWAAVVSLRRRDPRATVNLIAGL